MLNIARLAEFYSELHQRATVCPDRMDMAYLVGQTKDNESSVLNAARDIPSLIGIADYDNTQGFYGYPGYSHWHGQLLSRGIRTGRIVGIEGGVVGQGSNRSFNTLTEIEALVRYAKTKDMRRIVLVAPHWHLPRVFMTGVTAIKRYNPDLLFYPLAGKPLPWDEQVKHSQGKLTGSRADLIFHETCRLFAYHEKGDLSSAEEALEYLKSLA